MFPGRIACLFAICRPSEDEKVKEGIKELFEELWFKPVSGRPKPKLGAISLAQTPSLDVVTPLPVRRPDDGMFPAGDVSVTVQLVTVHYALQHAQVFQNNCLHITLFHWTLSGS